MGRATDGPVWRFLRSSCIHTATKPRFKPHFFRPTRMRKPLRKVSPGETLVPVAR